jgi:L-amino acid N-acyltransferase YncA
MTEIKSGLLPERLVARYPKTVTLPDGAEVQLRLMTPADGPAILAFARALPTEDLLFLRVDLTEAAVVDEWMRTIETGHSVSVVAYDSGGLIGYATVHRNPAPWTRRVGELRVNVSRNYRARGLGRYLTAEIFDVARSLGLKKMQANMTSDQHGAQAAFRRLGFVPEALLADYVEDRNGRPRDMVIMCYDIEGHSDQALEPVKL